MKLNLLKLCAASLPAIWPNFHHAADDIQARSVAVEAISGNRYFVVEFKAAATATFSYQLSSDLKTWHAPATGGAPGLVESAVAGDATARLVRIDSPIAPGTRHFIRAMATFVRRAVLDFDGDGTTDWVVTRSTGGGPSGQMTWLIAYHKGGTASIPFGRASDARIPGDYDGDGRCDAAVWNPTEGYRILQSSTGTVRSGALGKSGDNPTVMADYDGDGKTDPAVFSTTSTTATISYIGSIDGAPGTRQITGVSDVFPAPGDYDGDGKADICVQTGSGGIGVFRLIRSSDGDPETAALGQPTDMIAAGDYDGDGRSDFAGVRISGDNLLWSILERDGGGTGGIPIALGGSSDDFTTPGDYDGDGKTDVAIWNSFTTTFSVRQSSDLQVVTFPFGQTDDIPVAFVFTH